MLRDQEGLSPSGDTGPGIQLYLRPDPKVMQGSLSLRKDSEVSYERQKGTASAHRAAPRGYLRS